MGVTLGIIFATSTGMCVATADQVAGYDAATGHPAHASSGQRNLPSIVVEREAEKETPASLVLALHQESGLTWEQIARLLGVSRRAVHMWGSGGNLNAQNYESLAKLVALIRTLPGDSPSEKRTALLVPRENSLSYFDALRRANAAGDTGVNSIPVSLRALLG
jgi:DNA-binding transcriptional regulator YiaG